MRLENIGFYTLSDARAKQASVNSPLWRCELILSDKCNFRCPYCRGLAPHLRGDMPYSQMSDTLSLWGENRVKNIRFSGGEPTLYPFIYQAVRLAKMNGAERIAISTNGSASQFLYSNLIEAGVNDFSVSLDACCSATGDKMSGASGYWDLVTSNIKFLSQRCYTTVGIVLTSDNQIEAAQTIRLADKLGVHDIRIIPAAQSSDTLHLSLSDLNLKRLPILKYRTENMARGRKVRGLIPGDSPHCYLALDDMAVAGGHHFPCIIYLRENGMPIGRVSRRMRQERAEWVGAHDCQEDVICRNNCLDVCSDYNNRAREYSDKAPPPMTPEE
jgi:MoaA/NifB/PqqE/SkfB family radical SAM enzyme